MRLADADREDASIDGLANNESAENPDYLRFSMTLRCSQQHSHSPFYSPAAEELASSSRNEATVRVYCRSVFRQFHKESSPCPRNPSARRWGRIVCRLL
jgi:hypothetical protein